jgi:pyridoxamine 5'-phosphate oxidase
MKILSLNTIHEEIWDYLENGIKDTSSSFHFPIVSSIDANGNPSTRTVVLRRVNKKNKIISFNTDIRSNKWIEIKHNKNVSVHIYDFSKKTQIRIKGTANLNYENEKWLTAWNSTPNMSRECYASPYPPSIVIKNPEDIDKNIKTIKHEELDKYKENFGTIDIHIKSIDWLYLLYSGHRRAQFTYKQNINMVWIAP